MAYHPNIKFPSLSDLDVTGPVKRSRYVQITHVAGGENTNATALQIVGGVFYMESNGGPSDDSNLTLPSAASLVTTYPGLKAGDRFTFVVVNREAFDVVLVNPGIGGTGIGAGVLFVDPATAQTFLVHVTDVSAGNEAYEVAEI